MYIGRFIGAAAILATFGFATLGISLAQTSCLKYPSGSTAPSGYGASWDVFDSAKKLFVKADCTLDDGRLKVSIGSGESTQLVYKTMHSYKGPVEKWKPHELRGTVASGNWLSSVGEQDLAIPDNTSTYYFVGYICTKVSGAWKCGCKNSSCTTSHWQLQAYVSAGGGGTGDDDDDASTPGTLPTAPVYNGTTYYVSPNGSGISTNQSAPGNPKATIEGVDDGSVIKFLPGVYATITATNPKQAGRIKMISTIPVFTSLDTTKRTSISDATIEGLVVKNFRKDGARLNGLNIDNFSGPWAEGFYMVPGSGNGIRMRAGSNAWIVRNHMDHLSNHQNGALIADVDGVNVLLENYIWNTKEGEAGMDYGLRHHGLRTSKVYITKNLVRGRFNQPISLKTNFAEAYVEKNIFAQTGNGEGLIAGQQPDEAGDDNTGGRLYARDNTFRANAGLILSNIEDVYVEGNNFVDTVDLFDQCFIQARGSNPVQPHGKIPRLTVFKNNWINDNAPIKLWPRGSTPETVTIESNTLAGGGRNSIIVHRTIGAGNCDTPPGGNLVLPTVNRVGGDASGFSAPQTI